SYLISGHRGAGKTTLVQVTVEQVRQASVDGSRQPLIINLSGPSLFASPPLDDSGEPTVLPHILNCWRLTEALTLAVQREFLARLRQRAGDDRDKLQTLSLLQTRLSGGLEVADLFNVWQAVLGEDTPLLHAQSPYPEILSLWNNIRLHQITAGTPTATFSRDQEQTARHEQGLALSSTLDKLTPLLVALLSGGVAGIGLDAAEVGGSLAVVGAGLVALLAGLTADVTIRWDRSDTHKQAFEYNPDFSVNALPRMLPELVDQLWNVGLAPVFVIDELDKIDALEGGGAETLADKMKVLLNHIKSFVTEQSAFFFLVDRDYFEFVERSSRSRAYPIEHTYFNTRLYVSYQPTELRRFLDMVTSYEDKLQHHLAQRMISDSMLYRSRLHFFSLRQQLQLLKLRTESGLLPPPDALMLSPEWYYPFIFQAAVERSLEGKAMQRRQKDNSYFTQLAIDVLYYPAHRWEAGESFRLDEKEIRDWLQERLGVAEGVDSGALLSPTDRDFLFSELEKVIGFLCSPQKLRELLEQAPAPELLSGERTVIGDAWQRRQVSALLPPTIRPPLLQDHQDSSRYRWRCTPFGRPLEPKQAPALSAVYGALRGLLPRDADEIFGALISGFLLNDEGQPAYTSEPQLTRFRAHAAGSPAEGEDQLADLYELRRAIERQSALLMSVLMWMTALCAQQGRPTQAIRLRTLSILQQVFIETHRRPEVSLLSAAMLGELLQTLHPSHTLSEPLTAALSDGLGGDWAAVAGWLEELSSEALLLHPKSHALSEAREHWEQRIRKWLNGRQPDPPTWRDLLTKIYLQPGAQHVLTPPGDVTAEQWAEVLEDLEPLAEDDPMVPPLQQTIRQLLAR
ncbi:MAG: hypothetical protein ACI8S6_004732, partial [Myxococcota bacterium]